MTDWGKTSVGLSANTAAGLCYLLGWLSGIVFLLLEKENKFVRFHAMQSLVTFGSLMVISLMAHLLPFIGMLISIVIGPATLFVWLLMMYKGFQGERYSLPFFGELAERQLR
ncbi:MULTISPECIES: DUF4870 domain-containing protein [Sporomusaceae]|uniref:DUF4870 domain-containing protein n=1 Tax=Sporomusaceae TaxID=1843490 RepID=UPI00037405F8|nr:MULTISPECIES: DUF4870 domain-containing protein [Sporomusaceae]